MRDDDLSVHSLEARRIQKVRVPLLGRKKILLRRQRLMEPVETQPSLEIEVSS